MVWAGSGTSETGEEMLPPTGVAVPPGKTNVNIKSLARMLPSNGLIFFDPVRV
jgi:hypothetical protein